MYIYVETSEPRKAKDAARIVGPLMRGPQCMTFYYHMYGYTMSCVVIYIRRQGSNRLRPVWLKSENRGRVWTQGQISINETGIYQVSCAVNCFYSKSVDTKHGPRHQLGLGNTCS